MRQYSMVLPLRSASQARRSGNYSTAPRRRAAHRLRLGLTFITLLLLGFGWHVGPHRTKLCQGHGFAMPSSFQFGGPSHVSGRRNAAVCRGLYIYWWPRLVTIIALGASLCCFLPEKIHSACARSVLAQPMLCIGHACFDCGHFLTSATPGRTQPPILVSHTGPWNHLSPSGSFQIQHYVRSQVRTALLQIVLLPAVSLCSFDRMGTHTCSVRGEGWCLCLPTSTGSLSICPSL